MPCAPHIDDCCLSAPNPLFCTLSGDTGIGTTQIPSLFCQPPSYWGSANGPSRPGQGRRDCLPFCLPFLSVPSQQELSSSCWFQPLASFHLLLPGKSHVRRSLVGCSPWDRKESDTTAQLHFHALEEEMATHSSVLAWRIPGTG